LIIGVHGGGMANLIFAPGDKVYTQNHNKKGSYNYF